MLHARWVVVAIAVAGAGCVAPPIGLGAGAHRHAADHGQVSAAFGASAADGREAFQVDAAIGFRRSPRFIVELGAVYTQVAVRKAEQSVLAIGGFPYIRPRWTRGPWSFALAAAAMAGSGGETGVFSAFVDGQLGYGTDGWSVYTGAYGLGFAMALGPGAAAVQGRVGAEKMWRFPGGRLGVAAEVYLQADWLAEDIDGMAVASQFPGAALKLRLEN
jgi:hypothetical protein